MMRQWIVMYNKEMLEMWRSFKWLWVPLVFILLGIMQPVSTYYLPQILESVGGLPEGAVIEIPMPTSGQTMAEVISQYGSIGLLVIVLASMTIVSGEKQSRTIGLVMVRPIPYSSFITAKWAGLVSITWVSLIAGCLSGWYYTELLIGPVDFVNLAQSILVYGLWLTFIVSVTVLMSTWLKGNSAIAFLTILIAIGLSILTGLFTAYMQWSPARLPQHAANLLVNSSVGDWFGLSAAVTFIAIMAILFVVVTMLKRQPLGD